MRKACVICHHRNSKVINEDLIAGFSIPDVSLKHFGDYHMLEALRRHKRSHLLRAERKAKNKELGSQTNAKRLSGCAPRRPRRRKAARDSNYGMDQVLIATEPVRIKGIVYPTGMEIPESAWNPDYLAVALRLGTVRRKAS
jgi:hypothetical protein